MSAPMLEATDLRVGYGVAQALFDVSLSDALVVYEGSIPRLMSGQGSAWMAPPSTGTSAPVT